MPTNKKPPLLIHKGNANPKEETTFYMKRPYITDIIFSTIDNQGGYLKILDILMSTGHKKDFYVSVPWIVNTAHVSKVTYYAFRDIMKYIGWIEVKDDTMTILYDEICKGPVSLPTQKELVEIRKMWDQGVECSLASGGLKAAKERLKSTESLPKDANCTGPLQIADSTESLPEKVQGLYQGTESLPEEEGTESLPDSSVKWGNFIF